MLWSSSMEVALQLNLQDSHVSVAAPPLKIEVCTRHILKIGFNLSPTEREYAQGEILYTNYSIEHAIEAIRSGQKIDAVLIHPDQLTTEVKQLKDLAKQRLVPLILYTSKYDVAFKEIAIKSGMDDYFSGNITSASLKRIDFMHKLKNYKNQRGNRPYTVQSIDDVPKIKLWALKRTFDIAVSGMGLLLLSPLLIVIAILVKLESKGPIFYIAKRAGSGYKIFNFYKFRTMRVGADKELQKLAHMNQYGENGGSDQNNVFFKIKDDPRVTRFGRFLRDSSLDEIPQLFNVLKGDMSLVGNRPLPLYEAEKLTKDQIAWRFLAPAGITGLWQVTKRGKEDMSPEERIALDMEYAIKNSFWLDMKILYSTVPALLQKVNV